jgi:hypothetical protein
MPIAVIAQGWIYLGAGMLMGLAFGAAFLTSAPAIVAFLLLPTIWNAIVGRVNSLAGVARWLDSAHTLAPLTTQTLNGGNGRTSGPRWCSGSACRSSRACGGSVAVTSTERSA